MGLENYSDTDSAISKCGLRAAPARGAVFSSAIQKAARAAIIRIKFRIFPIPFAYIGLNGIMAL